MLIKNVQEFVQISGEQSAVYSVPAEDTDADRAPERLHEIFRLLAAEPRRVPASEAREAFSGLAAWCSESERPAIVTNHGKPEAVLLSFNVFERALRALAREVLDCRAEQSPLSHRAEELLEAEAASLSQDLRRHAPHL